MRKRNIIVKIACNLMFSSTLALTILLISSLMIFSSKANFFIWLFPFWASLNYMRSLINLQESEASYRTTVEISTHVFGRERMKEYLENDW